MLGVGGGDTAADEEEGPGLGGSDDEEDKSPSDNDEDDEVEAEELEAIRLGTLFSSAVKSPAKGKLPHAKAKVQPQQNTRPAASGTPQKPNYWGRFNQDRAGQRSAAEATGPTDKGLSSGQAALVERLKKGDAKPACTASGQGVKAQEKAACTASSQNGG